jgi:hypothetical protein
MSHLRVKPPVDRADAGEHDLLLYRKTSSWSSGTATMMVGARGAKD